MSILQLLNIDIYHTQKINYVPVLHRRDTHKTPNIVTTPGFKKTEQDFTAQVFARYSDSLLVALQLNTHHPVYNLQTDDMGAIHQPTIIDYAKEKTQDANQHDLFYYNGVATNLYVDEYGLFLDHNKFQLLDDVAQFEVIKLDIDENVSHESTGIYVDLRNYTNVINEFPETKFDDMIVQKQGLCNLRNETINLIARLTIEAINYLDETTL